MKKLYNEPVAEKLEFTYSEMVVASDCSMEPFNDTDPAVGNDCEVDTSNAAG